MAIGIGPIIPGLGVNYTSPAAKSNAVNIRSTGAKTGEANRFANIAPAGTTTRAPQPATAASALGLGNARTGVPASLSSTRAPSPQPTLIPANLDAAGRAGGANVTTTRTGTLRSISPVIDNSSNNMTIEGATLPPASSGGTTRRPNPNEVAASVDQDNNRGQQAPEPSGGTQPAATDAAAALDAAINALLDPEFIGFQGDRAAELRRLQNLRNQLFGDTDTGLTGSVQRQQTLDANARRRLAAQRAASGMLQGGAYAGTERGLGTMQRAEQDFAMQEMLRPFREQVAADRLREFGLEYDPTSRVFNLADLDLAGFTTGTYAGREAAARARQQAIQQLAQQGIQI